MSKFHRSKNMRLTIAQVHFNSHLHECTLIFGGIRSSFFIFVLFFDEIRVNKQISPRWDAAFCGVTSCLCPIKRMPGLYGLGTRSCKKTLKLLIRGLPI